MKCLENLEISPSVVSMEIEAEEEPTEEVLN